MAAHRNDGQGSALLSQRAVSILEVQAMDHRKLARDVKRYIADASPRPVHIPALCKRFKVHRRTLFRVFTELVGMPPYEFSRRLRFKAARAALKKRRKSDRIRDIAIAHGFLEQGRFARDYRQLFGELPSETRSRR
jgi:AraC family ethanolamine operon transcriptional activator